MKVARLAPVVVAACALLAGLGASLDRSMIPPAVDGDVERVYWVSETGYRLRTIELSDGQVLIVDRAVGDAVEGASTISKPAWSRSLRVDGEVIGLGPSAELKRLLLADLVVLVAVTLLVAWRRRDGDGFGTSVDAP